MHFETRVVVVETEGRGVRAATEQLAVDIALLGSEGWEVKGLSSMLPDEYHGYHICVLQRPTSTKS